MADAYVLLEKDGPEKEVMTTEQEQVKEKEKEEKGQPKQEEDEQDETLLFGSEVPLGGWQLDVEMKHGRTPVEVQRLYSMFEDEGIVDLESGGKTAFLMARLYDTGEDLATGDRSCVPDVAAAFEEYVFAMFCGHAEAALKVGEYYAQGYNTVHINQGFAKQMFLRAWRGGIVAAAAWLARLECLESWSRPACEWLNAGLTRGCGMAMVIANWCGTRWEKENEEGETGLLTIVDEEPLKKNLDSILSAPYRSPDALFLRYLSSVGSSADMESLREAAFHGHADAQWFQVSPKTYWPAYNLSAPADMGFWTEQMTSGGPDTLHWLSAAARQHHPDAMADYSTWLLTRDDFGSGFAWALGAAGQGSAKGYWNLGTCFWNGWGTKVNKSSAMEAFHKAQHLGIGYALPK